MATCPPAAIEAGTANRSSDMLLCTTTVLQQATPPIDDRAQMKSSPIAIATCRKEETFLGTGTLLNQTVDQHDTLPEIESVHT